MFFHIQIRIGKLISKTITSKLVFQNKISYGRNRHYHNLCWIFCF